MVRRIFRHGEDSLDNDGLICFAEVDGVNKEYCLSKVCDSIEEAINTSYKQWEHYNNQGGSK